jgi:hypothetical protein
MFPRIAVQPLVAALLITGACARPAQAPSASSPPRMFVGEVAGTDARVAVVATERSARVYFCGGDSSVATSTKWLRASIDGAGRLTPENNDGRWRLDGVMDGNHIMGSVDRGDGVPHAFDMTMVTQGTIAGLYETTASCGTVGVIVTQSSPDAPASAQGACIAPATAGSPQFFQVNPLGPLAVGDDGAIAVLARGTEEPARVRPATPPGQ